MTNRDHSPSIAQNDARDAKPSGEGSGLDLDALERAAGRIHWSRTRRLIDGLRRDQASDGTADLAADELERLADAFEFTVPRLIQTQRELVAALEDARFFIQDSLTNGHLSGGDVGNLMGARDVIDRALIAKAEGRS